MRKLLILLMMPISVCAQTNTFPTSGNVGIGTTSPNSKLTISNGNSSGDHHPLSGLTIEDDDNVMVNILSPSDKVAYYGFSDSDDPFVGGMQYDHVYDRIQFRVNNRSTGDLVITNNGYIGINTISPEFNLHVAGGVKFRKTTIGATVANADNDWIRDDWLTGNYGPPKWNQTIKKWVRPSGSYNDIGGIVFQDEGTYFIRKVASSQTEFTNTEFLSTAFMFANIFTGNVGIGTTTPDSKLTVKGKVHAEEVKVDLSVPGPDYVFKEGYNLRSLEEVQDYINKNGHLPNIPSAKEMETDGVELGIMNMKLLEKIEELTLYILGQEKKIETLKNLENRIRILESKNK